MLGLITAADDLDIVDVWPLLFKNNQINITAIAATPKKIDKYFLHFECFTSNTFPPVKGEYSDSRCNMLLLNGINEKLAEFWGCNAAHSFFGCISNWRFDAQFKTCIFACVCLIIVFFTHQAKYVGVASF